MAGRFAALYLLSTLLLFLSAPALADSGNTEIGRQLSAIYCGSCHAINKGDGSKSAPARPFQDLGSRLSTAVDNDTILEELSSHHPNMPPFDLTPNQAADIVAYIGSIEAADRGHRLIETNCSPCHAIERSGTSPHPDAPPFRTLSRKYPVSELEEALAEGIMTGHPDMPEFIAEPEQIDDMIAYLESIQEQ
jgi:cytochrome c